jgi:hypothetical protein
LPSRFAKPFAMRHAVAPQTVGHGMQMVEFPGAFDRKFPAGMPRPPNDVGGSGSLATAFRWWKRPDAVVSGRIYGTK